MRELKIETIKRNVRKKGYCYSQLNYWTLKELTEKGYIVIPEINGYRISLEYDSTYSVLLQLLSQNN